MPFGDFREEIGTFTLELDLKAVRVSVSFQREVELQSSENFSKKYFLFVEFIKLFFNFLYLLSIVGSWVLLKLDWRRSFSEAWSRISWECQGFCRPLIILDFKGATWSRIESTSSFSCVNSVEESSSTLLEKLGRSRFLSFRKVILMGGTLHFRRFLEVNVKQWSEPNAGNWPNEV